MVVIPAILIIAAGAALQAATGMGMALFSVPLLVLLDPGLVPGPLLCTTLALSAAVAWRGRAAVDRHILAVSVLGFAAGSAAGALLLSLYAGADLSRLFGGLILFAIGLSLAGLPVRANRPSLLVGGMAAGVLGTMVGVQGPPIALVLQHQPPRRLRATLCAFFAVGSLVSLATLAIAGVFGLRQVWLGIALLPGVPLGPAVAPLLTRHIDRERARWCVLAISARSALALLLR